MKNRMIIYTDSSWRDNKCGYAFSCNMPSNQIKPTFIYGNCLAKTSTEAEMIAVIKAMEYIKQYCMHLDDIKYEIRVDEQEIVQFMTKKPYKHRNKQMWKYTSGRHRRKNIMLWYKLMRLLESFPQGIVRFKKVKSKIDSNNFVVDKVAYYIANEDFTGNLNSFVVSDSDYKSIVNGKVKPKAILINEHNFSDDEETLNTDFVDSNNSEYRNNIVRWMDLKNSDIVPLPVEDIIITELEHLNCKSINFKGMLSRLSIENEIVTPIAVRRLEETSKYSLVAGITRLFSAKILGIKTIPAIITEMSHKEFIGEYSTRKIV